VSTADESKQAQDVPVPEATEAQIAATAKSGSLSPGAKLRVAREGKGMSLEQVAKETLLTSRYLKALEADDYDTLPGTTFVRGYLRRYAGVVGVSADELVAEFDVIWQARTAAAALVADEKPRVAHKPAAYSSSASSRRTFFTRTARQFPLATLLSWGSVLLLLALLLGSLFWNDSTTVSPAQETSETIDLNAAVAPTPATVIEPSAATAAGAGSLSNAPMAAAGTENSTAASTPDASTVATAAATSAPAAAPAPAAKPVVPAATPVIAPAPSPAAANTAAPTTTIPVVSLPAAPAEAAAPVPPRSDTLSFNFTGKSWISVRDSTGQELVYGLKNAGQSVTVTGQPPFAINIGSVRDTQMSRNGTPINLKPYTRGEIASFRLGR
jgi:cytoskeleton protein RodZ